MPIFKQIDQSAPPKAPDFSRHENCSQEQIIASKVLFKAPVDTFDQAAAEAEKETESDPWVNLYDKLGAYYGWSWKQFYEETPYRVIKMLNAKLDKKFESLDSSNTWLNYNMISTAMAISRCFGGDSDS
jgi:hypothetical protein